MTTDMITGIAMVGGVSFVTLIVAFFAWIDGEFDPLGWWHKRKRKKSERDLPLYERLARAEERSAESYLDRGWVEDARKHFREAKNIRREATDAMMRGEEPKL